MSKFSFFKSSLHVICPNGGLVFSPTHNLEVVWDHGHDFPHVMVIIDTANEMTKVRGSLRTVHVQEHANQLFYSLMPLRVSK